jgi:hypothetical protein
MNEVMTICKPCEQSVIGQVPGQVYGAQVRDENGNGLKAGFFNMDINGQPISNDAFTDDSGYFHFTYPAYNADKIFMQIFSTDEYEPYVASFDELVANGTVTLKKKVADTNSNGLSTEATLALIGIGIGLISLQRSKTVGSNKATVIYERFKRQPNDKKLLIVGGLVIGGVLIYELIKYKPTPDQQKTLDDAQKMLDILHYQYGIDPSLPIAQYSSYASTIRTAVDDCGTDENSIYRVFEALNNEADIYMLIIKCKILSYKGCFTQGGWLGNIHKTLPEVITSDMTDSEVNKVNSILSDKDIQYRF